MQLPIYQSSIQPLTLMQTRWKSILDPVVALPTSAPSFLTDVVLTNGSNVINHKLGRTPQGWVITDSTAAANIYRSAAFNDLTLTLTSSSAITVSIMVF